MEKEAQIIYYVLIQLFATLVAHFVKHRLRKEYNSQIKSDFKFCFSIIMAINLQGYLLPQAHYLAFLDYNFSFYMIH